MANKVLKVKVCDATNDPQRFAARYKKDILKNPRLANACYRAEKTLTFYARVCMKNAFYFLNRSDKKWSSAAIMLGVCGAGAFISTYKPASSIALMVLFPNAPINVPFCINKG